MFYKKFDSNCTGILVDKKEDKSLFRDIQKENYKDIVSIFTGVLSPLNAFPAKFGGIMRCVIEKDRSQELYILKGTKKESPQMLINRVANDIKNNSKDWIEIKEHQYINDNNTSVLEHGFFRLPCIGALFTLENAKGSLWKAGDGNYYLETKYSLVLQECFGEMRNNLDGEQAEKLLDDVSKIQ